MTKFVLISIALCTYCGLVYPTDPLFHKRNHKTRFHKMTNSTPINPYRLLMNWCATSNHTNWIWQNFFGGILQNDIISPQRSVRPSSVSFVIFDNKSPDFFNDKTSSGCSLTLTDLFDSSGAIAALEDATETCAGIRGLISMVKSTSQSRGHFCTNWCKVVVLKFKR